MREDCFAPRKGHPHLGMAFFLALDRGRIGNDRDDGHNNRG
jgi:hypothetical protein